MNDNAQAWAHQLELERRRWEEERAEIEADPAYAKWLTHIDEQERTDNEISSESGRRLRAGAGG